MVLIPYWISGGIGRWFEMQLKGRVGGWRHICWSFLNTYAFDCIHPCTHTDTHIFYLFRRCLCASALALCASNHAILSGLHSFYHSLALQLSSTLPSLWVIWHLPLHYYTLALTDSPGASLTQEESTRGQGPLFNCIEDLSCISRNICWKISKLSRGLAWPQTWLLRLYLHTDNTCSRGPAACSAPHLDFLPWRRYNMPQIQLVTGAFCNIDLFNDTTLIPEFPSGNISCSFSIHFFPLIFIFSVISSCCASLWLVH